MRWLVVALAAMLLSGCHSGTLPDPNDPHDVGPVPVQTLRKRLKSVSDVLNVRQAKGQLPPDQYQSYIKKAAEELLKDNVPADVPEEDAWQYADLYIAAQQWKEAKALLVVAVRHAKAAQDEDRWVNDSLRLARAEAEIGEIESAIEAALSVQSASPGGSAPILPGTLLEIVPAARGKGHDVELAKLLEGAIACHMRTVVDPKSDAGQAFLLARPHHIRKAWEAVIELYESAKRPDLAKSADEKAEKMLSTMAQA